MSGEPLRNPMRASDADRDRVVDLLRAAVEDGRLDADEFSERMEAALSARTLEALAPLTADLVAVPGPAGAFAGSGAGGGVVGGGAGMSSDVLPAEPAARMLIIRERHGVVRRDGRWTLPHRLVVRTAWTNVTLDLTQAVRSGPELVVDLLVRGGDITLVLLPGMTVDANDLGARFTRLAIAGDGGARGPEILHVRLVGRAKHAQISATWAA